MISALGELRKAKALLEMAKRELEAKGAAYDPDVEAGALVETPAAALSAGDHARECDFLVIDSNGLVQSLLAAGRGSPWGVSIRDPFSPAVLRSVKMIVDAGAQHGVRVTLRGGLAGRPEAAPLLVGLGLDSLSVAGPLIPEIRWAVRNTSLASAKKLARRVLELSDASEVRKCLGVRL
jgi:phosphoenolpyruvate-protein kinase (PTS system EI component)